MFWGETSRQKKPQNCHFSMNPSFSHSFSHRQYLKQESLDKKRKEFDTNGWALLSKKSQVWTAQNSQRIQDFLGFLTLLGLYFFPSGIPGKKRREKIPNKSLQEEIFHRDGVKGEGFRWEWRKSWKILGPPWFFQQDVPPDFPGILGDVEVWGC